jgi:phosphotransferase system HPr (HPr) family protein
MNGETLRRRVRIANPQGFHLRPQEVFVRTAKQFESAVVLRAAARHVNGKSMFDLMTLGDSAMHGCEIELEVTGADASAALDALAEILAAPSLNDDPAPPLPKKG